jgi:bifunctional ADP-heptose synthase (sugar kinase/adenylyltransferase)
MSKDTQQQKKSKILLIGDSCIDEYFFGICKRINPEAPVPLLDIKEYKAVEGMSSNVKQNLCGLGFEVEHITNKEIIKKTRYIDSYHNVQLLRTDTQQKLKNINVVNFKKIYDKKKLKDISTLVISDYDKGFLSNESIKNIINYILNIVDIPIFVDSKKTDVSCFENCFLKINEHEYKKIKINTLPVNSKIIITLGENGAKYENSIFPAYNMNIDNVKRIGDRCGAGDTFLAGLICKYLETQDTIKSIKFANICASFTVKKIGAYQIKRKDIENICI